MTTQTLNLSLNIKVPAYWFDDARESIAEWLSEQLDNYNDDGDVIVDLTEVLATPEVDKLVLAALTRRVECAADISFYASEVVADDDTVLKAVKKILAPQVKIINKHHADVKKAAEQDKAREAARKEEIKKQGVPVRIPADSAQRAVNILRTAGIEVQAE